MATQPRSHATRFFRKPPRKFTRCVEKCPRPAAPAGRQKRLLCPGFHRERSLCVASVAHSSSIVLIVQRVPKGGFLPTCCRHMAVAVMPARKHTLSSGMAPHRPRGSPTTPPRASQRCTNAPGTAVPEGAQADLRGNAADPRSSAPRPGPYAPQRGSQPVFVLLPSITLLPSIPVLIGSPRPRVCTVRVLLTQLVITKQANGCAEQAHILHRYLIHAALPLSDQGSLGSLSSAFSGNPNYPEFRLGRALRCALPARCAVTPVAFPGYWCSGGDTLWVVARGVGLGCRGFDGSARGPTDDIRIPHTFVQRQFFALTHFRKLHAAGAPGAAGRTFSKL